jgi:hypothetical protein
MIFPDMLIRSVPLNWFCNKFWSNKIQFDTVAICCQYLTSFVMCTQKVFGLQKRNKNVVEGFMQNVAILSTIYSFLRSLYIYLKDSSYYLPIWLHNQDLVKTCLRTSIHCTLSRTKFVQGPKTQGPDIAAHAICPPGYWSSLVSSAFRYGPKQSCLLKRNLLFFTTPMTFGLLNSLLSLKLYLLHLYTEG